MADFSQLLALHVSEETLAEYTFIEIPGRPSIWFAPGTDANPLLRSERYRLSIERSDKSEVKDARDPDVIIAEVDGDREVDRKLLAKCCAKKWGTPPLDVNGNAPEFTEQNCYDFFTMLPVRMFEPLRGFVSNELNFVDKGKLATLKIDDARARNMGNVSPSASAGNAAI